MTADIIERTVELLRAELATSSLAPEAAGAHQRLVLPFSPGAEYRFRLWFYADGDREIGAERIDTDGQPIAPDLLFWYHPFELPDFENSADRLARAFDREILGLLHVPTRVWQRRGWLMSRLGLEREATPGTWERVYQHAALFTLKVASTPAPRHVFLAPPVVAVTAEPPAA
jgi:hypothetical protein